MTPPRNPYLRPVAAPLARPLALMVGSPFILIQRPGRRTLLNAAEIVSAYTEDIDLASNQGKLFYKQYDPAQGTLYTVQMLLTSRREMEHIFTTAAARDELFARLLAAMTPGVTIDIDEPRPVMLPEEPMPERPKPSDAAAPPAPPAPKPPRKPRMPRK